MEKSYLSQADTVSNKWTSEVLVEIRNISHCKIIVILKTKQKRKYTIKKMGLIENRKLAQGQIVQAVSEMYHTTIMYNLRKSSYKLQDECGFSLLKH